MALDTVPGFFTVVETRTRDPAVRGVSDQVALNERKETTYGPYGSSAAAQRKIDVLTTELELIGWRYVSVNYDRLCKGNYNISYSVENLNH